MKNKYLAPAVAAALLGSAAVPLSSAAKIVGYMGDINHDMQVNVADLVMLTNHILNAEPLGYESAFNADLDKDGIIDVFDCVILRKIVSGLMQPEEIDDGTPDETEKTFMSAPIKDVESYLPSQGDANLVIFYIDFPDCRYGYEPSESLIEEIAFGDEDTSDVNYPFDSMSAFYGRSSKGAMNLKGRAFRYTTKNEQSYYNEDKSLIVKECYDYFSENVDFSQFDGNGDGYIDATLLTVPTDAGDEYWWPCAGPLGRDEYSVDGMKVGHIITGNAQIMAENDYKNFNSSYLHEMGHCMGLPDYYLYNSDDSEGMHGIAGAELMDTDASTDFGASSKLQLGWYREDKQQVKIIDKDFTGGEIILENAQGEDGNCVLIPCGEFKGYNSEFMLIEYTTPTANNSNPEWWQETGEGVRVYHVDSTLFDNGWWVSYKYGSGSEFTDNDNGRRLIRIIDDVDGDNLYHEGDVIDSSITGFNWYDDNNQQTIDTGYIVTVGESDGERCTINISLR